MVLRLVPLSASTFGEIAALGARGPRLGATGASVRPISLNLPALYARIFSGGRFLRMRTLWDAHLCVAA